MNILTIKLVFLMTLLSCFSTNETKDYMVEQDYQTVAKELLVALKNGAPTEAYVAVLEKSTQAELQSQLTNDAQKLAFWVNVYNAYIQVILKEDPSAYEDRRSFFKKPQIKIAGELMCFADIEHGIIRRSQFEYFLGYVRNPFVARYKKRLRPKKEDFRVHFALNCGAKSCPPVAIYTPENLDEAFDKSARKFLHDFSEYDKMNNNVLTTPLFSWFRGDFGGKKGTKRILERYGVVPSADVGLSFNSYDWTLDLDNYIED